MIIEIEPEGFSSILPLYRSMGMCFPLILAVIHNKQRGQVFVEKPEDPNSAVVVTNFGFMSFIGSDKNEIFNKDFCELLANRDSLRPNYLLWYSPLAYWRQRLDAVDSSLVRRRERVRFEFREERANFLIKPEKSPHGFELRNLDAALVSKTDRLGVDIASRFWASASDFSGLGLGVCLIKNGEVVSLCYSACIVEGLAEVDVVIHPDYRGRGLGTIIAQYFIRECVQRGITPTWDCFLGNVESMKLAEKLGFIRKTQYAFYSFNTPLQFVG